MDFLLKKKTPSLILERIQSRLKWPIPYNIPWLHWPLVFPSISIAKWHLKFFLSSEVALTYLWYSTKAVNWTGAKSAPRSAKKSCRVLISAFVNLKSLLSILSKNLLITLAASVVWNSAIKSFITLLIISWLIFSILGRWISKAWYIARLNLSISCPSGSDKSAVHSIGE